MHSPRANTFSICAVNPETGEAGVGVASRCLSAGAMVPYARAGVGAIATQAFVNPVYGVDGLRLLENGIAPTEIIRQLTAKDRVTTNDDPEAIQLYHGEQMTREGVDFEYDRASGQITWHTSRIRQVAIVDRKGRTAVHCGECIFPWNGYVTGNGFSCQGNMLTGQEVVEEMASAFEQQRSKGQSMTRGLLSALQAGEAAGGDKRGKQAAAILVSRLEPNWIGTDKHRDLRVDDHPEPVKELARIVNKIEP